MKKWYEKLSKKELVHLIDSTSEKRQEALLDSLRRNLKAQKEADFDCYACQAIAKKLDIKY